MKPHSTVPPPTASSTCKAGTTSPGPKTWIWNAPSVISETRFAKCSCVP